MATPSAPVARRASVVRVKQTVELPEGVYDQVQDYARGHRTSFQVLARALFDDLLTGDDHEHRARLATLIATAEQDKRARKRRTA